MSYPLLAAVSKGAQTANAETLEASMITAITALIVAIGKVIYDLHASRKLRAESIERDNKLRVENRERDEKWQKFASSYTKEAVDRKAELAKEMEVYVRDNKWKEGSLMEGVEEIKKIKRLLWDIHEKLGGLVELAPDADGFKIIKRTADLLNTFGDFQSAIEHHSIPWRIRADAAKLADEVTVMLLNLSLDKDKRIKERPVLEGLWKEFSIHRSSFKELCNEFSRDPWKFDGGSGDKQSESVTAAPVAP